MSCKFKVLPYEEEALMPKDELIRYYEEKQNFYKKAPLNRINIALVHGIRKLLIKIASKTKTYEIVYINDLSYPKEGCIIATNHKGFNDLPILLEVMPEPFHFLAANDVPMPKRKLKYPYQ